MKPKLEYIAWNIVEDCGSLHEFTKHMQSLTADDISEDCAEIWNQHWSKEQEENPECDY
jgi:hypothetical protein